jgi:DNA-binding transcriptional MerR regulator
MHTVEDMCRAGCTTARGVRYWEDLDLLGPVERSNGGNRRYTDDQMDKARIIAAAQFGGFALDTIKEMLLSYDAEVFEALMTRLADQARACVRLGEQLPRPPAEKPALEFDL